MPSGLQKVLMTPNRSFSIELQVPLDSGDVGLFTAHRVQHSNARGPYKGGLVYHPCVTLEEMSRCAGAYVAGRARRLYSCLCDGGKHSMHF